MKGKLTMRAARILMTVWLSMATAVMWTSSPAMAAGHALIQGSGSSWAANAVLQWIADVHANGLQVVFSSTGSAQGRIDYASGTVDFAVSDIGYQGVDTVNGTNDTSSRPYAYIPIVAGGTALPYQIRRNGQLVRNLRLSGSTIAKIFTQKITNWNDPQITHDNNGNAMPDLPIIPVQHSEGSGSSYQFTRYLSKEYPSTWTAGATEYFPAASGNAVAENGSDGVMNFLTSAAGNGAIGYDEYSYALGKNYPVAKVLNSNGYYTLPNQFNVAVALTQAQINLNKASKDYLLQNLDNVYVYADQRTYPISSYSYAVIPTAANDTTMTTAKRQTLADYLQYSVCQGQGEMGKIGYSPLPVNLVQASFDQITKLHAADPGVNVSQEVVTACHNPTFYAANPQLNCLAKIAPPPPPCDKSGAGPCTNNGDTGQSNGTCGIQNGTPSGNNPTGNNRTGNNGTGNNGTGNNGTGNNGTGTKTGTKTGTSAGGSINPVTGQYQSSGSGTDNGASPVGQATVLADNQSSSTRLALALIAGGLLVGVLIVPAIVATRMKKRGEP